MQVRYLTNSEAVTWRRCRRTWMLKYYLKLGPKTAHWNENREIGNASHFVIAAGYEAGWSDDYDWEADLAWYMAGMEDKHSCDKCEKVLKSIGEYAKLMVAGYLAWLEEEGADQDLKLMAAEEELEIDPGWEFWGTQIKLIGKIDARFQRISTEDQFYMDHKTVQDLATLPKYVHLDTQFKWYMMLQKVILPDVRTEGGIANQLRRVKRSSRAKPPFYGRFEVRHNDEELRNFWWQTHHLARDIISMEMVLNESLKSGTLDTNIAYPTPTKDCSWDCDFFNLCQMLDDGSDWLELAKTAFITIDPLERYGGTR